MLTVHDTCYLIAEQNDVRKTKRNISQLYIVYWCCCFRWSRSNCWRRNIRQSCWMSGFAEVRC